MKDQYVIKYEDGLTCLNVQDDNAETLFVEHVIETPETGLAEGIVSLPTTNIAEVISLSQAT